MAASPLLRLARDYAWPHRWTYLAGATALAITNWLTVAIPVRIGAAIDAIRAGASPAEPIAAIAAMGVGVIVARTLSRVWVFNPGRDVEFQLRQDVFARLMAQQPPFYATRSTGDIVSRASNDVTYVRALIGFAFLQVMNVSLALGLTGWRMVSLSWRLTLGAAVPVLIGLLVVRRSIARILDLHRAAQERLGVLSDHVLGSLQGIATIQGFAAEPAFMERFAARNEALFRTRMKMSLLGSFAFPALVLSGGVAMFVILRFGGAMAVRGELSVGDLAAFAALLGVLLPPLRSLGWMLGVLQRGRASLERIFELLDAPLDRPELPEPEPMPAAGRPGPGPGFALRDLTVAYPDEPDRPVLRGITADIPPGAVVGIFGRTGSGKSTLVRVLARLLNPPPGTVFIVEADGTRHDLVRVDLDRWRERLAVAPQRPFLFGETIARNIALADDPPPGRVARAVRHAALEPDVAALPDGLDTVVGERGIMLSGGQRQRVALARALYRDADVVVLDDVLSAVDHDTEARLVETLRRPPDRAHRPTTLVVSHRLSALAHADLVLVLDEGRLVDQGTHAELVGRPGPYREAWLKQVEPEAAEAGA